MFPKQYCEKQVITNKHVDTVVNSIKPLPSPITKSISNTHNNQRPQVGILQLIHQHCFVQTKILFVVKIVIHMTVQNHITQIRFF